MLSRGACVVTRRLARRLPRSVVRATRPASSMVVDDEVIEPRPATSLTPDERLVRDAARHFARDVVAPRVRAMDAAHALDGTVLEGLFASGLMAIEIPDAYGGAGGSFVASCLAIEEIARVDPAVAVIVDIHNTLVARCVEAWGSASQRETWLPRLAADTASSFCLSEPGSGSDAFALRTRAERRNNDDTWVLNGEKAWISNAREAGVFLVFATVDSALKHRGVTCFVVPRETEGLSIGPPESKLGIRASSCCPVHLSDVVLSDEAVLGEVGRGYKMAMSVLNEGRIGIAAQMVGLARGALDEALAYTAERKQFGRPIVEYQGVQFPLAQLAADIRAARALVYDVARLKEQDHSRNTLARDAAMAKLVASQVAERTASQCVELLGGVGFTTAYLAEKFYRDAKIGAIYEGTTNMQLLTIAKHLREEGAAFDDDDDDQGRAAQ